MTDTRDVAEPVTGFPPLSRLVAGHAERAPDRTALTFGGERWTYAQVGAAADALAAVMAADALAGERVALLLPNSPETVLAYLACFAAGAIAAPLDARHAPPEIERALRRCRPSWLVVHAERVDALGRVDPAVLDGVRILVAGADERHERLAPLLLPRGAAPPAPPPPDAPAVLFFTSGSGGTPKGVLHDHTSARAMLTSTSEALGDVGPDDVVQVAEPQVHVSGFIATLTALGAGGTVALLGGFDLDAYVAGLQANRPTLICTHIDVLAQVIRAPGARHEWFTSLRGTYTGGDTVPARLQREFTALAGQPICVGWGMTEAIWLTVVREPHLDREGCIGRPVGGAEVTTDPDTGELLVRGPMRMAGYWEDAELTRATTVDGWLRTGDLGSRDEEGLWWFAGRSKDVIVRRTSKITPGEVEAAIDEHDDVFESAVIAADDPEEGQVPVAFVVPRAGRSPTAEELVAFLRPRIAAYKIPARFHFPETLPLTSSGKIAHHALHEP
ncbi:class I adenylate-forming enzyme family protein [Pseudonocardia sp. RS010]|uniref:class I adenylate-forming enzyme family protein n=1 Tax=Pseudonocardia sp. RS010 TaxID=3385979 RepID=UPI0039A0C3BD